ncbi:MAG: hypothetical protein HQ503_03490, partial [Rhodospirillales bacterium]|nr:hypothetical protein [Rhodospirillales bacterium]
MLSSREVIKKSGISRATLNNYIALGLIIGPLVKNPDSPSDKARRLGYFPESVLDRLNEIADLKKQGLRMAEISRRLGASGSNSAKKSADAAPANTDVAAEGRGLRLTVDQLEWPAYLVNNKFEVEWENRAAEAMIFGVGGGLSGDIAERNLFRLLFDGCAEEAESRDEILDFHLSIAKNRLNKAALLTLDAHLEGERIEELAEIYDRTEAASLKSICETEVNLAPRHATPDRYHLYASFFREGIFFTYAPSDDAINPVMTLLARRDLVIRDLLKSRKPYMTPLAVLVADIQSSVKICAELPPEEYFELINQVWATMDPIFRKFYATHGKHVGDGMVYYFFPQPDCNYILNAVQCAAEMKEAMIAINRDWRERKNWSNELLLNIGLDEGQEWFGSYQTPTHLEFTVLGDTIN